MFKVDNLPLPNSGRMWVTFITDDDYYYYYTSSPKKGCYEELSNHLNAKQCDFSSSGINILQFTLQ